MIYWLSRLRCWLRGHKLLGPCCKGAHRRGCATCRADNMAAAYDPKAYQIGQRLWFGSDEVVVEAIKPPTTYGSRAWLMTRLVSVDPSASGGRIGAQDTAFTLTPTRHA